MKIWKVNMALGKKWHHNDIITSNGKPSCLVDQTHLLLLLLFFSKWVWSTKQFGLPGYCLSLPETVAKFEPPRNQANFIIISWKAWEVVFSHKRSLGLNENAWFWQVLMQSHQLSLLAHWVQPILWPTHYPYLRGLNNCEIIFFFE